LKALKKVVDLNVALANSIEDEAPALSTTISQGDAQENLAYLRTQVESWLAVLFNVYGSVNRDSRGLIGDVINSWLFIAGDEVSQTNIFNLPEF
jgi:ribosomal RNA-processing protein 12